ncbi:MAG: hypothetical protein ACREFE_07825 [Limisphaerales bacterium]
MKKSKRIIQTTALALAAACSLSAANASVTYSIGNGGLGTFNGSIDGTAINDALAGGIAITETAGGDSTTPKNYITVCTDIEGSLYLGHSYTYDAPVNSFSGLTGVNPTWGAINTPGYLSGNSVNTADAMLAIQNAAYIFNNYGQLTSTGLGGTTDEKEALQLAVWTALYDTVGGGSVTGTRFSFSGVSAAVQNDVTTYLSGLNGSYDYPCFLLYPDPVSGQNDFGDKEPPQELLIAAVPEASTVIAGALLLLPFGVGTLRRILRKTRAAA